MSKQTNDAREWCSPKVSIRRDTAAPRTSDGAPATLVVLDPYHGGGIGNYLFHLCHSVLYAQLRSATLVVPRPLAFHTMNRQAVALDFAGEGRFYEDRIERIGTFIHGNALTRSFSLAQRYACMQDHVRPLFEPDPDRVRVGEDTLVIHVRSGDIFIEGGSNPSYGQPPIAWYQRLIEDSGYRSIVVVTQTRPALGATSPVVDEIRRRWPHVRIVSEETEHDFHTLRDACHLALSAGTFAVAAALLNTRLRTLHIPVYEQDPDPNFVGTFAEECDLGFDQVRWDIHDYDGMRMWIRSPEQLRMLVEHPATSVVRRGAECGAETSPPGETLTAGGAATDMVLVLGDSHALTFVGCDVIDRYLLHEVGKLHVNHDVSPPIGCYVLGPKTLRSVSQQSDWIRSVADAHPHSLLGLSFGEIDCRNHVHRHTLDSSLETVVTDLVERYRGLIREVRPDFLVGMPPVNGTPQPGDRCHWPAEGDLAERQRIVRTMNDALRRLSEEEGVGFVDILEAGMRALETDPAHPEHETNGTFIDRIHMTSKIPLAKLCALIATRFTGRA